jgi:hypothetical protein
MKEREFLMMLLIGRLKPNFYISIKMKIRRKIQRFKPLTKKWVDTDEKGLRLPVFEYPAGANNWFIKYGKRNQRIKKVR